MRVIADILRAFFRLLGLIFGLGAIGAIIVLVLVFLAGGGMIEQPLGQVWFSHHVESLNLTQAIVQRRLVPALWDPVIVTALGWPSWMALPVVAAVFLLISAVFFWLGRRFRR